MLLASSSETSGSPATLKRDDPFMKFKINLNPHQKVVRDFPTNSKNSKASRLMREYAANARGSRNNSRMSTNQDNPVRSVKSLNIHRNSNPSVPEVTVTYGRRDSSKAYDTGEEPSLVSTSMSQAEKSRNEHITGSKYLSKNKNTVSVTGSIPLIGIGTIGTKASITPVK